MTVRVIMTRHGGKRWATMTASGMDQGVYKVLAQATVELHVDVDPRDPEELWSMISSGLHSLVYHS